MKGLLAALRVVHPAPAVAVVTLAAVLGAVLLAQARMPIGERWIYMVASVAGSQAFVGALNDLVDRARDTAAGRVDKPLATGETTVNAASWVMSGGLALEVAALLQLGGPTAALALAATVSAATYDLWLARTRLSPLPYVVSFGILPAWIAAGVGVPAERIVGGIPLAAAFAAAAHLANALRDFDADARTGSNGLAQLLGRRWTRLASAGVTLGVGLGIGGALLAGGTAGPPAIALGGVGLTAVAIGARSERGLWVGMLVAAVAWTASWALSTA